MNTARTLTRTAVGTAASVAVMLPLVGCSSSGTTHSSTAGSSLTAETPAPGASGTSTGVAGTYRNGTYTERGVYGGAPSYMTFTVTIENNRITAVRSDLMPNNNDTSRGYQQRFAAALPGAVVGKSVNEVQVGVLAGSSSCGDGFNDALGKIKAQARITGRPGA
jgi:uncharacterized protein with FMN-binding domain